MADIDLTTTATVPSGASLTITVFEDVDGDGTAENTATQAIDDGTNTYTLSGFDAASGNEFWIEAEFDTADVTKTAELDSAGIDIGTTESIETDVAVLSFIPGESENSTRGGNPFNSAVSQFFPEGFTVPLGSVDVGLFSFPAATLHTSPLFDNWLTGDMILSDAYPNRLSGENGALSLRENKWEEEDEPGRIYRLLNRVTISFDTNDGDIDESTVEVEFTGESSDSVLEQEGVNNIRDDISGDKSQHRFTGGYKPRHYKIDTTTVEGTDAVRVTTVFGGYSHIGSEIVDLLTTQGGLDFLFETLDWDIKVTGGSDLPVELLASRHSGMLSDLVELLANTPNIFTFLEVTLTADRKRFVRMWDNSFFPEHAIFIDNEKQDIIGFPDEEGIRELLHRNYLLFLLEPINGLATPYTAPKKAYFDCVIHDRDCFDLPIWIS